ncbi:hypothetical protein J437_LFUL000130 [Ladona fulva]|uniref:DUF4806 domain-containing protein n=1 Tax=Ladona fulva TaxID=123851 RepID=A0A8K0K566_LADFU|nr:hypothetical protein J437_LFUL000130 [Ladona fulva]
MASHIQMRKKRHTISRSHLKRLARIDAEYMMGISREETLTGSSSEGCDQNVASISSDDENISRNVTMWAETVNESDYSRSSSDSESLVIHEWIPRTTPVDPVQIITISNLKMRLAQWCLQYNIPQNATTALFKILKEFKNINESFIPIPVPPQAVQDKEKTPGTQPRMERQPKPNVEIVDGDSQYKNMMRGITETKIMMASMQNVLLDLAERVNGLEGKGENVQPSSAEQQWELLNEFPLDSVEGLERIETRLEADQSFQKCLISALMTLGGVDVKSSTLNLLKKLMTNNLASKYSWLGLKKKRVFFSLRLNTVIKLCVRNRHSTATDEDVSTITKNWLRLAKLRLDREMLIQ